MINTKFNEEFITINNILANISSFLKHEAVKDGSRITSESYEASLGEKKRDWMVSDKFLVTKKLIDRIERQVQVEMEKEYYSGLNEYYSIVKKYNIDNIPGDILTVWRNRP